MRRAIYRGTLVLTVVCGCASGETILPGLDGAGVGSGGSGGVSGTGGQGGVGSTGGAGGSMSSSCDLGETEDCYGGAAENAGVGACVMGTRTCVDAGEFQVWGECTGWVAPAAEVCDGIDSDCDGDADTDCCTPAAEQCDNMDNDCDGLTDEDGVCALNPTCKLKFPPAVMVPCEVDETATLRYVDAVNGADVNPGTDPSAPWATLAHAVAAAPAGSTIRVAAGNYGAVDVSVAAALTIKGGYDPTFTTWDPDVNWSMFGGRLTLGHAAAVWAGFRMVAHPMGMNIFSETFHTITAGSLVRNYVEIVFTGSLDSTFFDAISAATDVGKTSNIRCNDIYLRTDGSMMWSNAIISFGVHSGKAVVDANRICYDEGPQAHPGYVIAGYGPCSAGLSASVQITNNVLENARNDNWSTGVEFYGCGDADLNIVMSNNTVLANGSGISGYGASPPEPAVVHWKLTNNIVLKMGGGGGEAIDVGSAPGVDIVSSEHNLTFGWANNGILPVPLSSVGDDTSGLATPMSVFADASSGDFHLVPGGEGDGTGLNVFGLAPYGAITTDLEQIARPAAGAWDRGAFGL